MSTAPRRGKVDGFACTQCGAKYSRLEYLKRHERKHTDETPFTCPDCGKSFARSDVVSRHRRRCHPESTIDDAATPERAGEASSPDPKGGKRARAEPHRSAKRNRRVSPGSSNTPSDESPPQQSEASPSIQLTPTENEAVQPPLNLGAPTIPEMDAVSSMLALNGSGPPEPISASSPMTIGLATSSMAIQSLLSPSLFPFLLPASPSPSNGMGQNQIYEATGSSASWPSLHPDPSFSAPSSSLTEFQDSGPSSGRRSPVVLSPNLVLTDADLLAYLMGNPSPNDYLTGLGLDIFQPERSLMDAEQREVKATSGPTTYNFAGLDPEDRFYIPPGSFEKCYTVPHWVLPSLYRLGRIASHTLDVLTSKMSIVHEPTFRLASAVGSIGFAMCTIGTPSATEFEEKTYELAAMGDSYTGHGLTVFEAYPNDPWKWLSSIVREQKSGMMVKKFALKSKTMDFATTFSFVQTLIIMHTPSFVSDDPADRISGLTFLTYIVQIARQAGLFKAGQDWLEPVSLEGWDVNPLDADQVLETRWKEWIRRETVRRTVWLVYVLDTIAFIEAGTKPVTAPRDMRHLPLPAPAPIWNARTARQWLETMQKYAAVRTLDEMVQKTFDISEQHTYFPSTRESSGADRFPTETLGLFGPATRSIYTPACIGGNRIAIGPFARLCVVVTLLRGLIEFGEGRRKGGQVTQIWAVCNGAERTQTSGPGADRVALEAITLAAYKRAFDRWRMAWDVDQLCHLPVPESSASSTQNAPTPDSAASQAPRHRESTVMHDATPYFWLSTVLLNILQTKLAAPGVVPRPGVFGDIEADGETEHAGGVGGVADADNPKVNLFKGLDYRSMLDVAKQFAHSGEGI